MGKRCVICGDEAEFIIKNSQDAYCKGCALDCFSDLSYLQKVEKQAQELKYLVKKKMEEDLLDQD
ncbi:MAG: hypothetical protein KAT43_01030 [Nanoarchaeota archaeon]|nr:hypothetical protein [Nanoarchaeota archaeon]